MATFLFINDDERIKYAKKYLKMANHQIIDYYSLSHKLDYLVLPFKGINDEENLLNLIKANKDKTFIIYNQNDYLKEVIKKYQLKIISLKDDPKFIEENSSLSSEGLLKYALEALPESIRDYRVLIIGQGNLGKAIRRDFSYFCKDILVSLRDERSEKELISEGVNVILIKNLKKVIANYNLIINTVPSLILNEELLHLVDPNAVILDASSFPYGTDFKSSKILGIKAFLVPSIPLIYAPKTAGKILKEAIERGITK